MNVFAFAVFYLINIFFTGFFFSKKTNLFQCMFANFSIGFIFQIAIIEFLGWWMVTFSKPVVWFAVLVTFVCFITTFLGIRELYISRSKQKKIKVSPFVIVLIILICIICCFLYLYFRSDADDSFYVSNVLLFSKSHNLNPYDSSFGNKNIGTLPMYDFQIWESYLAVFCKLFSINATVMCHFIMVFLLLLVAVSSYYLLGHVLFANDSKRTNLFVVVLLLFYLMGGYAVYSKGSFLLSRLWQGKAVYLHVVLPVAIAVMLKLVENKKTKFGWLLLLILMYAGIGLNPTSMYVVGFQILCMMIVISIYNKNIKYVLNAVPSIVVVGFYSILMYISASKHTGQMEAASQVSDGFVIDVFKSFFGDGIWFFVVYLICVILTFFFGELKGKILCIYTPLLMLFVLWNPVMGALIAENLTMTPSYWRVFWLIPIDFAIAYCVVLFYEKRYIAVSIALGVSIIVCGKFMFTKNNNFIKAENMERIPEEVIVLGDIIASYGDGQVVLANDMASTTLRQEYNEIELIFSRAGYILDLFRYRGDKQGSDDRFILNYFVNSDSEFNSSQIIELLDKYHTKWIVINSDKQAQIEFLSENGYVIIQKCKDTLLFCRQ